jgi:hypothetical protein
MRTARLGNSRRAVPGNPFILNPLFSGIAASGSDFGRRLGIAIPVQLRHFFEEPVAEGNDLAARFDAGRLDQPIAACDRNRPVDGNGQPAGGNVIIDQRQTAHRDTEPPGGRFQGQLRRSQHQFSCRGNVSLTLVAPSFPVFSDCRRVDQRRTRPIQCSAAQNFRNIDRRANRDETYATEQVAGKFRPRLTAGPDSEIELIRRQLDDTAGGIHRPTILGYISRNLCSRGSSSL